MKNFSKKLSVLLISAALLTSQSAFAARMGKSRSLGMQRNTPTQTTTNNSYQPGANAAPTGAAPQKSGPGIGGVVAGAAAGAVGGYMLGKAMNSDKSASSQVARETASSGSNIPWGIIGILGILLAIGLMLFRKKSIPQAASGNLATPQANNNFNIPNIRKDNGAYAPGQTVQANQQTAPTVNPAFERMADGVEAQYFLRQAKGMFLHIQSMNTPENVSEVEKYMTPELYAEVKQLISENDYIADFSQLDCQLLASSAENGNFIASVKFFGKVSESPNTPAVDFSEIWNFIKPATVEGAKWLVAGIQQTNSIN